MHMAVTSQFRRSSCSPLEVYDLHTLWAAAFAGGPFFLAHRDVIANRRKSLLSHSFAPETGERDCRQSVTKGQDLVAVVENPPRLEGASGGGGNFPKALEICCHDRCRCLYFKTNYVAALILQNDIDLVLILVTIMMESRSRFAPFGEPEYLVGDERFEQGTKHGAVLHDTILGQSRQRLEKASVEEKSFGVFVVTICLIRKIFPSNPEFRCVQSGRLCRLYRRVF
jgi:hypothetical protein